MSDEESQPEEIPTQTEAEVQEATDVPAVPQDTSTTEENSASESSSEVVITAAEESSEANDDDSSKQAEGKSKQAAKSSKKEAGKDKKKPRKDLFKDLRDRPKHEIEEELKVLRRRQSVAKAEFESLSNERQRQISIVQAIRGAIAETKGIRSEHKGIIGTIGGREKDIRELRSTRDSINAKVVLPLQNIEEELLRTYENLTAEMKNMRYPGVKQEEKLFSFFFELQEMHKLATISNDSHQMMITEITDQRTAIANLRLKEAEHDDVVGKLSDEKPGMKGVKATPWEEKAYNRQIMKLLDEIKNKRKEVHGINREVGRLDAFIRVDRKKSQQSGGRGGNSYKGRQHKGPNVSEIRRKAASGESMSLADLGALMSSGGLSTIKPEHSKDTRRSKKKSLAQKKIGASRGSRSSRKPSADAKRKR